MEKIKLKKLREDAVIPTRGSERAAGADLYAAIEDGGECAILPHTTKMVHTGVSIQLPKNTFGAVFARSGLASKRGLRPANCVGVIDEDYTGEIMVALHNDTESTCSISNCERVAQLVVIPCIKPEFEIVETLEETERGEGGFGSTGTH